MDQPCIAFFPIVRVQFDVALAEQMIQAARENLVSAGFKIVGPDTPISDLASARAAIAELSSTAVDLLLIFQATFADSTMVTTLAEAIDAPIFLWAVPEEMTGGRLRLNSLCGINLAGHALTLRKRKYDYAYAAPDDSFTIDRLKIIATAGCLRRRLRSARLGVVGEHPGGMDTCHLDEPRLKEIFGITVQRLELDSVFLRARGVPAAVVAETRCKLGQFIDNLDSLQQQPFQGTLSVYNALKEIAVQEKLDGLAVRCWPEFFTQLGCAACGAMSLLSDGFDGVAPIPCSCEADINGTLTQLILHWLAGEPAFGTDMVAADIKRDFLALWHCGLAPLSMADPAVQPHGGNHSNRGVPLILDFPLKPGRVTIARISQATGELRLVLGRGEVLPGFKPFSGTSGLLRLERPVSHFLDSLMYEGLEHHVSLVYGDYTAQLEVFASLVGLPIYKV